MRLYSDLLESEITELYITIEKYNKQREKIIKNQNNLHVANRVKLKLYNIFLEQLESVAIQLESTYADMQDLEAENEDLQDKVNDLENKIAGLQEIIDNHEFE